MNNLKQLFKNQPDKKLLSIYFTAGHPNLESTGDIILSLQKSGVDFIEVGMPFSDPMADGEVIQGSSEKALSNGMNLDIYFRQLEEIKNEVNTPLIAMGYVNQMMTLGVEEFLQRASNAGISAVILPDLPIEIYEEEYKDLFLKYDIENIFLITPQSSSERIRKIDSLSDSFIYLVSSSSTTGNVSDISIKQEEYFKRITQMNLKNPLIVGFGIKDAITFSKAVEFTDGAIIGSAFVKHISENDGETHLDSFIRKIR